jgi:hypothetical protein
MSNVGQGVFAAVGGVVGFIIGGPTGAAYGFQIGLLAGSALFPTQLPGVQGPRLQDLDTAQQDPGAPVPIVYGTCAITGTVMWLGEVIESSQTDTVGGKGAPEQDVTTYTYSQSVAIGLCEGPLGGVLRIWENGRLVYDARPQLAGETDADFVARGEAASAYLENLTIYLGTEDQEPDPTIEADKGVGNVPAFRGLAYMVYANRQLTDDQGRRHPVFKVEVSNNPANVPVLIYDVPGAQTWTKPRGLASARVTVLGGGGGGGAGAGLAANGFIGSGGGGGGGGFSRATFAADVLPETVAVTVGAGGAGGTTTLDTTGNGKPGTAGTSGGASSFGAFLTAGGGGGGGGGIDSQSGTAAGGAGGVGGTGTLYTGGAGGAGEVGNAAGPQNGNPGQTVVLAGGGGGGGGALDRFDVAGNAGPGGSVQAPGAVPLVTGGAAGAGCARKGGCQASGGGAGGNTGDDPYSGGGGGGGGGCAGGNFVPGSGPAIAGPGAAGGRYGGGGGGGGSAQGRVSSNIAAVALGGAGGPGGSGAVIVEQTYSTSGLKLADVVQDISRRAGLWDVDVEQLRDIPIDGYVIGRPMPARAALEPLRSFGWFDGVESGFLLRYVKRGGVAVAELGVQDLGASAGADRPPPAITTRKIQDVELPRQVRVQYIDVDRDYEPGEQLSPTRITTEATNDVDVAVPVVMNGTKAAQIAEILWSDAWRSRWVHQTAVDGSWLRLEPTDPILVPVDGRVQRMRIVSVTDEGPELRRLELVRDDDGSYISYAVAEAPDRRPNVVTLVRDSAVLLLDLPALRDEDDDPGFYAAAYPIGPGTVWQGAVLFKSIDGGQSFAPSGTLTQATVVGTLAAGLPDGISSTFDEAAELLVDLEYGTLESRTEAAILAGANAAAIGADGRWQIVQFRDAEQLAGGRWRLTGILRGRKGTEYLTGGSRAGDRFVMVSTGTLIRVALQLSEVGALRVWRSVSVGRPYSTGTNQEFTGRARALLPWSPVDIGIEASGGDRIITWSRRDRFGQELQSGVEVPMSEDTEAYEVDVFDRADTGAPLLTLSTNGPLATLTEAQRYAIFGSPSDGEIAVAVHQMSARVGRGVPGYFPAELFASVTDETVDPTPEPPGGRSVELGYLEFVKSRRPGDTSQRTLEARARNPAGRYVLDLLRNGGGSSSYSLLRFNDGNDVSVASAGVFDVTDMLQDPTDPRFVYLAQLFGGNGPSSPGPGLLRRVNIELLTAGGLISGATVAQRLTGLSGDPQRLALIDGVLYAACPFENTVARHDPADLSPLFPDLFPGFSPFYVFARGTELWAATRARPASTVYRLNPVTGAVLSQFNIAPFCVDVRAVGDFLYAISIDDERLYKYRLPDGALLWDADFSAETWGDSRNYLQVDGARISAGRVVVRVYDSATDEQLYP